MKPSQSKLDENRKMSADGGKHFEKRAREIHEMANKVHKKMEQLHRETVATRERAHAARIRAEKSAAERRSKTKAS